MTTLDGAVDLARDRELVERCQTGDEGSFAELYDRYNRRLLRFCLRRLHSHDDAEEAVQEAFTRAWRALPHFGGDRRFYPWLTVIAGNVCTDMLRRQARVVPMDEMPLRAVELDGEDVDEQLLRRVDLAMATEAFAHLSDRHQRVLRLRESTEWSAQRIAEHEGVAVPAVDTLLWRARQAFKREFSILSDAGGLAGILGIGVAALKRSVARAWLRVASQLPGPMRGPGAITATVALTGAAIAGGSVALVGAGNTPVHAHTAISSTRIQGGGGTWGSASKDRSTGASAGSGGAAATNHDGAVAGERASSGESGEPALNGITGARGAGTPLGANGASAPLGHVISGVGGIAGSVVGGVSSAGSSVGSTLSTAVGSVGNTVGSVAGTVESTLGAVVGSATGTSGTGSSGTGASNTSGAGSSSTPLRTLVHTATAPLLSPSAATSASSASGSSAVGSLLGGL